MFENPLASTLRRSSTYDNVCRAWNIHRADYQQTLADAAKENGAAIVFNANCVRIDVERPAVILEDGRELTADLIVGADGIRSAVRKSIPALADIEILPHLEHAYRCTVPKERMAGVPKLDWLLQNGDEMMWSAQGKYILSWPLPDNRPYVSPSGSTITKITNTKT